MNLKKDGTSTFTLDMNEINLEDLAIVKTVIEQMQDAWEISVL